MYHGAIHIASSVSEMTESESRHLVGRATLLSRPFRPTSFLRRAMPKAAMRNANKKKKVAQTTSRAAPGNWLAWLDEHVQTVDPPTQWTNAPAFMLVRYPDLRPKRPWAEGEANLKGLSLARLTAAQEAYDEEHQDFWRDVSGQERKLAALKASRRVLTKLNSGQRQQLAALVSDSILSIIEYPKKMRLKRELQSLVKTAPAQVRKSKRKLHKIIQDAEDNRNYTRHIHPWLRPGRTQRAERILAAARGTLENSRPEAARNDSHDALNKLAEGPSFRKEIDRLAQNPLEFEMVKLYWFFRHECKLPIGESEVRVAMIRNSFWTELGIEQVHFCDEYRGDEPIGCDAVRKAVERFRLEWGTTP